MITRGLAEWDGDTVMLTATAPGADVLPWDPDRCQLKGRHRHSGPAGCVVEAHAAAVYNATAGRRGRAWLNYGMGKVREAGYGGEVQALAVIQELKRGVFHVHPVIGWTSARGRTAVDVLCDALDSARGRYGFGTADRGFDRGKPGKYVGEHAGVYASKYLRPDGVKGSFIPALAAIEALGRDEDGKRAVVRPVWVNPRLTAKSGVTMRFLRWERYLYCSMGRKATPRHLALRLYAVLQALPGSSLEALAPVALGVA